MSQDLKVKLQVCEVRYEELRKILSELTELNIIKMRSGNQISDEFFNKFQDMTERVITDIEDVKKECEKLHKILYPERYEESY